MNRFAVKAVPGLLDQQKMEESKQETPPVEDIPGVSTRAQGVDDWLDSGRSPRAAANARRRAKPATIMSAIPEVSDSRFDDRHRHPRSDSATGYNRHC